MQGVRAVTIVKNAVGGALTPMRPTAQLAIPNGALVQMQMITPSTRLAVENPVAAVLSHLCPDSAQSCFGGGYYVESSPWSESEAYSE